MVGYSLHLGLNKIDRKHYGTDGTLSGCVNDAKSMESIARDGGFLSTLLLDEQATSARVLAWLTDTSHGARSGDTVFVSFAGHGSQVTDTNSPTEPDGKDETWCLYDRMLIDDELGQAWSRFASGVRIVLVSDSCHSATVARMLKLISEGAISARAIDGDATLLGQSFGNGDAVIGYRVLPDPFPTTAERNHRELYTALQRGTVSSEDVQIAATVISLTACQDDEVAGDGRGHGVFTQAMLEVWADGRFGGGYKELFAGIKTRLQEIRQHPNYRLDGSSNASFEAERPFTVALRKQPEEDTMDDSMTIDERLSVLLSGNGSRIIGGDGPDLCRMVLNVPREALLGKSDQEVFAFLQQNAAPTLMKAFLTATSVKLTARDVEGHVECHADSKGNAGCSGGVSIRF